LTISFALHQFSQTIIRHTVWLYISAPRSAATLKINNASISLAAVSNAGSLFLNPVQRWLRRRRCRAAAWAAWTIDQLR
jgi:hypothetical protein